MSGIPQTKMLAQVARRRRLMAFLSVAAATFFCLGLFWPITTKMWRSESDVSLRLTKRKGANDDFRLLLEKVVSRHTSVDAIEKSLRDNGMGIEAEGISTREIAEKVVERLHVNVIDNQFDPDSIQIRVGLDGIATDKENYFVNLLATTFARDFMTSPLAGILPDEPIPASSIEELEMRRDEIETRANELLAQIGNNLKTAADQLAEASAGRDELVAPFASRQRDTVKLALDDLMKQRERIALAQGDSTLELAAIDQQIEDKQVELSELVNLANQRKSDGPFQMASHTLNRESGESSIRLAIESLRSTISELANVTSEACSLAEAGTGTQPAFEIQSVQGRSAAPVGAIPGRRELLFLVLASTVFASIVSLSYHPFFETGFENVKDIEKQLMVPVVATLENRNEFEDVTGPGIPAESIRDDAAGSNQVVNFCKWILFCSLMLTIGFCLVNADVREAFLDGPFQGYARIVWALKGN